ncbi:acyl-CoA dehydrogenase family protein [Aeropyrum camini]|uniref:Acyl-CoA dehydrogenase n=1 Tax=Aeropyrum camini SY1 = JCM 12091 TaxID=1198449 RepID=U3TGQ3_9CREN|nr:acyl-CoA dehydrogenase family protein [Aeropyrum camini]BAN90519.1 acyl-CoA dehydrogenase [Aeropyrum camini SY1 = JCM 12091]
MSISQASLPWESDNVRAVRESVREFAEKKVAPKAREIDATNTVPESLLREGAEMGFFALRVPEEYGGPGLSLLESVVAIEELSRASSGYGLISVVSGSMVVHPILKFAGEEVKEKYLSRLAKGAIGAFALTEPCCGTDVASLHMTTARKEGGEYVVSGQKIFITNSAYADFFIVAARTGRPEERHRGISLLVVDKGSCVEVSKLEMMGYRGSGTSIVYFNDCRVPPENLIGQEGGGFKLVMHTLNEGRISTSASGLGVMQAAFDAAVRHASERESMGRPIIEHQMVSSMIAEMLVKLETSRLLVYTSAHKLDSGSPDYIKYASMAKLHTATAGVDLVRMAMQVLGGIGYSKDSDVERYYRDIKMIEIGDGTNEVQRMVLTKFLQGRIRP